MRYRNRVDVFCFFFSSRRRHTRLQGDWSSDVCSSDLIAKPEPAPDPPAERPSIRRSIAEGLHAVYGSKLLRALLTQGAALNLFFGAFFRSEERRVGKECRSRWSPYH